MPARGFAALAAWMMTSLACPGTVVPETVRPGPTSVPSWRAPPNDALLPATPALHRTTHAKRRVRDPYKQPGGSRSAWNTPFGEGAVWGQASDPDTIDIARGWDLKDGGYTPGPYGHINRPERFGVTLYIGSKADGQYTFTTGNNGRAGNLTDNGPTLTARLHLPTGARTAGPYPGDNPIVVMDPVNYPNRLYTFAGIEIRHLTPGQGPFLARAGEWDDITADTFGEDYETGNSGFNVGIGIINFCDVDPACNPYYPRIRHALRYATDAHLLATNDIGDGYTLKPDSWPQRYQDRQVGHDVYSGRLKAGTTLGIPLATKMPDGLNANCRGAFWTMQHYPLFFRDQAGGGFNLTADQVASASRYVTDLRQCLPRLVALLRPLRNQHVGGESFQESPKNGPGRRVDRGPDPLAGEIGKAGIPSPLPENRP
jgi:hypothetical protein